LEGTRHGGVSFPPFISPNYTRLTSIIMSEPFFTPIKGFETSSFAGSTLVLPIVSYVAMDRPLRRPDASTSL
jgi:hypothetical protein